MVVRSDPYILTQQLKIFNLIFDFFKHEKIEIKGQHLSIELFLPGITSLWDKFKTMRLSGKGNNH